VRKIITIYQKIEEIFLIICFAIMAIILTSQIVCRYAFNSPLAWAEELARYLQIWITFVGIGYGIRTKSHIALTLLREKMPKKIGIVIEVFITLVIIISSICVIYVSPRFLAQQNKLASTLPVSLKLVYIALPIGFAITALYKISELIQLFKDYKKNSNKEKN